MDEALLERQPCLEVEQATVEAVALRGWLLWPRFAFPYPAELLRKCNAVA